MFEEIKIIIDPASTWNTNTPSSLCLNLPFYLLEYGHFVAFKNYYTKRKQSPRFLLFHTLSGRGRLVFKDKEYILDANSIAIIWCEKEHFYETISDVPWDFNWFHYNGSIAHEYYHLYNNNDLFMHYIDKSGTESRLISSIISHSNNYDLRRDLIVAQEITDLMTMLISARMESAQKESPTITDKLERSISFMNENIAKRISILDIANSVYLSQYHFSRLFKANAGITPYEYLSNLRINKAKELLMNTDNTLDKIASLTGFSDSKTLIYNFKKITGLRPAQYKKANKIQ